MSKIDVGVGKWSQCMKYQVSCDMVGRCYRGDTGLCELKLECPEAIAKERFGIATGKD